MPNLITSIDLSLLPGQASDGMDTADDSKYDAQERQTRKGGVDPIFM